MDNVKISFTPLKLKEGILANNDILSYEEFRTFFLEKIDEKFLRSFLVRLGQIEGCIKKEKYKEAHKRWEKLQQEILFNKDYNVSLLFVENIDSPEGKYEFKYASKEYDVLGSKGKLTRLSKLSQKLYQADLEEQIAYHLSQFITDVDTKKTRYELITRIFKEADSDVKSNASNARWHTKDWTYRNILYGKNPHWRGNVTDAFINHMAHLHIQSFSKTLETSNKNLFATSVFNEEKQNLWKLLYDSRNNLAWYTGGDVIIKYDNQIFNIQVKTGINAKKRSQVGGDLAVNNLLKFIESIKNEIKEKNIEKIIEKLYNELKTSGWVEFTEKKIENITEKVIKNSLTN